jgi:hypothetical protein
MKATNQGIRKARAGAPLVRLSLLAPLLVHSSSMSSLCARVAPSRVVPCGGLRSSVRPRAHIPPAPNSLVSRTADLPAPVHPVPHLAPFPPKLLRRIYLSAMDLRQHCSIPPFLLAVVAIPSQLCQHRYPVHNLARFRLAASNGRWFPSPVLAAPSSTY